MYEIDEKDLRHACWEQPGFEEAGPTTLCSFLPFFWLEPRGFKSMFTTSTSHALPSTLIREESAYNDVRKRTPLTCVHCRKHGKHIIFRCLFFRFTSDHITPYDSDCVSLSQTVHVQDSPTTAHKHPTRPQAALHLSIYSLRQHPCKSFETVCSTDRNAFASGNLSTRHPLEVLTHPPRKHMISAPTGKSPITSTLPPLQKFPHGHCGYLSFSGVFCRVLGSDQLTDCRHAHLHRLTAERQTPPATGI